MNIIAYKNVFLAISGLLVFTSIIVISLWGLNFAIDFTGGSLLEVEFAGAVPSIDLVRGDIEKLGTGSVVIQPTGERGMIMRFGHVKEEVHQEVLRGLEKISEGEVIERRFDTIGPTIGAELKQRSLVALAMALGAIILYIAFAFRKVSKPVSSWKYGIAAIAALVHDIAIPTGIFAALGKFSGVQIDALFVTALLTILGFSVHDTIVVFDRIRENLRRLKTAEPFEVTVNRSMRETVARSINTSLTVLLVVGAVFFFGGETTRYFALALALGVIFGTYSSICIASPLLVLWNQLGSRKKPGF